MRYDKNDFLSGVAVGRNLASWPLGEGMDVFAFTIYMESAGTYSSPWIVFAGVIEWGDGTTSNYNNLNGYTGFDERKRGYTVHTYASAGYYTIRMVGDLRDWSTVQRGRISDYNDTLISIDTPFPATMSDRKIFFGCLRGSRNLVSLPSGLFSRCNAQDLQNMCRQCQSLTSIPGDLLRGASNVTNMILTFAQTPLQEIPPSLFAWSPNVEDISSIFSDCPYITEIPTGLFDTLAHLRILYLAFVRTSITEIPAGLFFNNPEVTSFEGTFGGLHITEIPPGLFDNCPNVTTFAGVFSGARITDIPAGLFANNTEVTTFETAFSGCENLTDIPSDLFASCPEVTSFRRVFRLCKNLTDIPSNLFASCPEVTTFEEAFRETGITGIPSGLFSACPLVESFYECFDSCKDVTGNVPELWNDYPNADGRDCFNDCTQAANYSSIPANWR